jgi:hypothetical protein
MARVTAWRVVFIVIAGTPALLIAAVFAYGYWHTVTHAVFRVEVLDFDRRSVKHSDAELTFTDSSGRELAQSAMDAGTFFISEPATFSCRSIERRAPFEIGGRGAYAHCFKRQTRWIAGWIHRVRYADARVGPCHWTRVPVVINQAPTGPADWWLFWPPHTARGSPYTSYYIPVAVDSRQCQPAEMR